MVGRIENILVLVSHFHVNSRCCNKTCRISHKVESLKRTDNFYSFSDTTMQITHYFPSPSLKTGFDFVKSPPFHQGRRNLTLTDG